jgi:hypothetical protein
LLINILGLLEIIKELVVYGADIGLADSKGI